MAQRPTQLQDEHERRVLDMTTRRSRRSWRGRWRWRRRRHRHPPSTTASASTASPTAAPSGASAPSVAFTLGVWLFLNRHGSLAGGRPSRLCGRTATTAPSRHGKGREGIKLEEDECGKTLSLSPFNRGAGPSEPEGGCPNQPIQPPGARGVWTDPPLQSAAPVPPRLGIKARTPRVHHQPSRGMGDTWRASQDSDGK